jgi:hypothetical protein
MVEFVNLVYLSLPWSWDSRSTPRTLRALSTPSTLRTESIVDQLTEVGNEISQRKEERRIIFQDLRI